jgi:hypothetical protein
MTARIVLVPVLLFACACTTDAVPPAAEPGAELPANEVRAEPQIDRQALGLRYAIPVADDDASSGASEAAITMVVFLDYGDETSARVAADVERLLGVHGDQLRVVIKPFTYSLKSDARYVARAVLAASRQGRGYSMHGRVIAHKDGIERSEAMQLAEAIGVPDLRAFGRDIDDQAPLDHNLELARQFGANPRSCVFINGAAYSKLDDFAAMLDAYVAEAAVAKQLLAAGVSANRMYAVITDGGAQRRAAIIDYAPPFDGEPIAKETLPGEVGIEIFNHGDGESITDDNIVSFVFRGYDTVEGRQVMGSREAPSKLVVVDSPDDPIAQAVIDSLRGRKIGAALRITVPASVMSPDESKRVHGGGLVMTIEIVGQTPRPVLAEVSAFTGKPRKSKTRADGLEIHDYAAGTGRAAKAGDQVTVHYIGQLEDGTEFDSSHNRVDALTIIPEGPGVIPGFAQAIVGARVGMLRKVVIPPALAYGDTARGNIPANSTLTFYLEIMAVEDAPPAPPRAASAHDQPAAETEEP